MFCPQCGSRNDDDASHCAQCGYKLSDQAASPGFYQTPSSGPTPPGPQAGGPRPNIPSQMVWAILTTLFCCLPFGVVSIVFAAQVSGKVQAGDYAGAMNSSRKAKVWAWVAFGCGLASIIVFMGLGILGAVLESQGY